MKITLEELPIRRIRTGLGGRRSTHRAQPALIHTPPDELPALFAEFRRVLAPGGYVLLAFQVGDERVRVERAYGQAVSLDAHRLPPDRVADSLARAGLPVVARLVREPNEAEKVPQAHLLARRPE